MTNEEIQSKFPAFAKETREIIDAFELPVYVQDDVLLYLLTCGETVASAAASIITLSMEMGLKPGKEDIPWEEGSKFPKESRVVKITKKVGDLAEIGWKGTLVGFKKVMDSELYFVKWDNYVRDKDEVNGVKGDSIELDI